MTEWQDMHMHVVVVVHFKSKQYLYQHVQRCIASLLKLLFLIVYASK